MRSISTGEANAAGTEARVRVAGASNASRTNWTGVEETKFLIGRKGEGEALVWDLGVCSREDKLLGGLSSENGVLGLLVPFLLLLLFDGCKEGKLF